MQTSSNRQKSVAADITRSISNPDLLLKNLRLLDLDEEFDWPGIDGKTFSASDSVKNLNKRLFCAAWILYKLFELLDRQATQRDWGNLFPSFDPKQSSLLRSALFKRLHELKVAGYFGKEVVVRKTMFEDCKGPKFEELLATLSSAVLLDVVRKDNREQSVVQRVIGNTHMQIDVVSLCVAYRASLTAQLRARETLQGRWIKFARTLERQRESVEQRVREIESRANVPRKTRITQRTIGRLCKCLSENWNGDDEWKSTLLHGDDHRPGGTFIEASFSSVWQHVCKDTLYLLRPQINPSRLQVLEGRVKEQRARLDRWKKVQSDILIAKQRRTAVFPTRESETGVQLPKYSLRSNKSKLSTDKLRCDNRTVDGSVTYKHMRSLGINHQRSGSLAIDLPQTDSRLSTSSGKSSLQKPITNTSIRVTSSASKKSYPAPDLAGHSHNDRNKENQSGNKSGIRTRMHPTADEDCLEDISEAFSNEDTSAADIVSSVLKGELSPFRAPLTLAERTRISMATMNTKQDDNQLVKTVGAVKDATQESMPSATTLGLSDLAQRTRKSMSARNTEPALAARKTKSRPSVVYPVNQFETPRKTASLEESIFDETTIDLDEEDIFKSRPKVAMSPVLSPLIGKDHDSLVALILKDDSYEDDFS